MNISGIVAEYNPLHNGHQYHLKNTREHSDLIVVALSQDTVQRGQFSAFDKWWRTKKALENGADLVIGLPFTVSSQSAEYFASGAVELLNLTGINQLSFGSETELSPLLETARLLAEESEDFKKALRDNLKSGYSFPKARELALLSTNPELPKEGLAQPNNILAIEYLKSILRNDYPIKPLATKRLGSGYHDARESHNFMSATGIRESLEKNNLSVLESNVPYPVEELKKHYQRTDMNFFFKSFAEKLLTMDETSLAKIVGVTPDILNKLKKSIYKATNLENFYSLIKSKDLPYTSISRIILNTLIGFEKELLELYFANDYNPYIRILGFNQNGRKLLKNIDAPLVTNVARDIKKLSPEQQMFLENEIKVSNLKSLYQNTQSYNLDYFNKPIITT